MEELQKECLKETEELLEKRFEEIQRLTDDLNKVTQKMKSDYLVERQMQVHAMHFNDIVEELKEEYRLVLAICVVYEFKAMKECIFKSRKKEEDEEEW